MFVTTAFLFCLFFLSHLSASSAAAQVRTASCAGTACVNSFGDEQLAVDMLADKLLFEALRFSVSGWPTATLYSVINRYKHRLLHLQCEQDRAAAAVSVHAG
jgi:hypothetical protein